MKPKNKILKELVKQTFNDKRITILLDYLRHLIQESKNKFWLATILHGMLLAVLDDNLTDKQLMELELCRTVAVIEEFKQKGLNLEFIDSLFQLCKQLKMEEMEHLNCEIKRIAKLSRKRITLNDFSKIKDCFLTKNKEYLEEKNTTLFPCEDCKICGFQHFCEQIYYLVFIWHLDFEEKIFKDNISIWKE